MIRVETRRVKDRRGKRVDKRGGGGGVVVESNGVEDTNFGNRRAYERRVDKE